MGYSLAWMGAKNVDSHDVLVALALACTNRRETIPESPLTGIDLRNGWYLVIANHQSDEFFADAILKRLSIQGEVVTCFVEEHVMYSRASGWKGGRKAWQMRSRRARERAISQCNADSRAAVASDPQPLFQLLSPDGRQGGHAEKPSQRGRVGALIEHEVEHLGH
jgi:hypothetical protein